MTARPPDRQARGALDPPSLESSLYVFPGDVVGKVVGCLLTTVLGSCVSVCLHDPRTRIGGMNHFLLPEPIGVGERSPRFAGPAIEELIGQLLDRGGSRERLVAKLFGGCESGGTGSNGFHIGFRNVVAARRHLTEVGIPIVAEDVGGGAGRRLVFDPEQGAAWVKPLRSRT